MYSCSLLSLLYTFKKVACACILCACAFVCGFVCQLRTSFPSVGQLLRCAYKRLVNIMKVDIERKNIQVELI